VIASDSPTLGRLLEDDARCGITLGLDDAPAQAALLQRWVDAPHEACALGVHGRAAVRKRYT
jgi:hypothetical protein